MKTVKHIAIALMAAALLTACRGGSGGGHKLRADTDSVAYIIGMNVGMNLLRMDSTLNITALCDGLRDAYNGEARFTAQEAEVYYLRYTTYMLPEKARAYEEQFLTDIAKSNRNYARTPSGVTYTVEVIGDQNLIPTSERDTVEVRYVIRSADGEELYSSYERGDTSRLPMGELVNGMQESLKLIGKGGKIVAWMPSSSAYGPEGDKQLGIAPNATLYYEIELLGVDRVGNQPRRNNLH